MEAKDSISIVAIIVSILGWVFVYWKDERKARKEAEKEANDVRLEPNIIKSFPIDTSKLRYTEPAKRLDEYSGVKPGQFEYIAREDSLSFLIRATDNNMSPEELVKAEESGITVPVGRCLIKNLGKGTARNIKIDAVRLSFIGQPEFDEIKPQSTKTLDLVFPSLSDDVNPYPAIEQITITYTTQNGEKHEVEKTVYI